MGKGGTSLCTDVDLRSRPRRQFSVSGNKIRVKVRLENVTNFEAILLCCSQIDVYIPLRIYHQRLPFGSDHVGGVRQTSQVELFKIHSLTPQCAASLCVCL